MFVECSLGPGYTVLDSMASSAAAEDACNGQVKVPTEDQRARWTESQIRWAVLAQEGWTDEDEKELQRLAQSVAKWRKYMGVPEGVEVSLDHVFVTMFLHELIVRVRFFVPGRICACWIAVLKRGFRLGRLKQWSALRQFCCE